MDGYFVSCIEICGYATASCSISSGVGSGRGTAAGESATTEGEGDADWARMNAVGPFSKLAWRGKGLRVCARPMGEADVQAARCRLAGGARQSVKRATVNGRFWARSA